VRAVSDEKQKKKMELEYCKPKKAFMNHTKSENTHATNCHRHLMETKME
jgi:hypothetical protein